MPSIRIADASGTRDYSVDQLPLSIGTAAASAIRVPGPVTERGAALIGELDGRVFVQLSGADQRLTVNGEAVASTRWLADGDSIELADAAIDVSIDATRWVFTVRQRQVHYDTLPPDWHAEAVDDGSDAVAAIPRGTLAEPSPKEAPGVSRLRVAGFGTLAILALIALYLVFARAVLIDVTPSDARIAIAGGLIKPKFGERYLLLPGEYRVVLDAQGYEPLRQAFTVGGASSQDLRYDMQPLPGRLRVTTARPAEGTAAIDGIDIGALPTAFVELTAGEHALTIRAERYVDFDGTVSVEGRGREQTHVAELTPRWADVSITTSPSGAAVFVGDEEQGTSPMTLELMPGAHDVVIRKSGYKTWRTTVTAVASTPQALPTVELTEADSVLTVITRPSGASVSIDGRFRGKTPADIELAPDATYTVNVSRAGFATVQRRVTMESKKTETLRFELQARLGVVRVVAEPADAELFVDGVSRGNANQELTLPARAHTFEIRKAGLATFQARITPRPGSPETLNARLLTPEEAVLAATPKTLSTSQGQVLRLVPTGALKLGAPRREQGRRNNEIQRDVRLERPFYIALREVTNNDFRAFKPKHTSGGEKYRGLSTGDHPAVMMSWDEAVGYCNWLSDKDGLPPAYVVVDNKIQLASPPNDGYRLPTEAEWAWVARYNAGGAVRKYPWGERMPPARGAGNFADQSATGLLSNVLATYVDGHAVTSPVGSFAASPLGIFDLGGNAAEWVNDRYSAKATAGGVAVDPVGPADGQYHVIRGSSWRHASISELRLAYRDFGARGRLDVGFRIARYAPTETAAQE